MKITNKIRAIAFCCFAGLCSYATTASAEEITVKASSGNVWKAECARCDETQPSNLKISVEPGDIIIFVQDDPSTKHGIRGADAELAKIALRGGGADDDSKIAVELETATMFGRQDFQKIGLEREDDEFPVEITRIQIKDNFSDSLALFCNVHGPGMGLTLKAN